MVWNVLIRKCLCPGCWRQKLEKHLLFFFFKLYIGFRALRVLQTNGDVCFKHEVSVCRSRIRMRRPGSVNWCSSCWTTTKTWSPCWLRASRSVADTSRWETDIRNATRDDPVLEVKVFLSFCEDLSSLHLRLTDPVLWTLFFCYQLPTWCEMKRVDFTFGSRFCVIFGCWTVSEILAELRCRNNFLGFFLAVAGWDDPEQLPGHDAVLSPGNPNVGHAPPRPARRQRESDRFYGSKCASFHLAVVSVSRDHLWSGLTPPLCNKSADKIKKRKKGRRSEPIKRKYSWPRCLWALPDTVDRASSRREKRKTISKRIVLVFVSAPIATRAHRAFHPQLHYCTPSTSFLVLLVE